ncbi:MAG TPA: hypothetical protein VM925_22685 [Labilithrix sp.]|jgi:hypothetical protein|nr:hypothetical protein [Labilithrix sp.]
MRTFRIAAFGVALTLASCTKYDPIGAECRREELAPGAVMKSVNAGGFAGRYRSRTYFEDGRVIVADGYPSVGPQALTTTKVSAERIRRLEHDLAATGIFWALEGCWSSRTVIPDGATTSLAVRHDGRTYSYSTSQAYPYVVVAAQRIASALDDEVEQNLRAASDAGVDTAL